MTVTGSISPLSPSVTPPGTPQAGSHGPGRADRHPAAPEWQISDVPVAYPHALAVMAARAAAIRAAGAAELVWLAEHPPLYTAGTSAQAADLRDGARFPVYDAGRGGQWTYHGPGQRLGYVMLDLTRRHGSVAARDVRAYVRGLEDWLIATLDRFGVRGERREGRVGIWIADRAAGTEAKIAALGVRVARWVSWHGVALNVDPDLRHYDGIVPCGVREHGVTSLAALGITATMAEVDAALRAAWDGVFGD
ncbi:lipoyl(octanoyl) transferase LipB [Acidisphaera rubrifaciens]|uniref:Octanoyltransferase n=1 Tax=Acidisphaera rubrifaciens HS-AP3 TaxID=1231350 RepID=A0A0D6P6A1_9PROT|nr:lipoyl(octanoyl) transferase LipB [Acidisphaera rubrifaciens]GAN76871.1 lipoate-protein ligase B [Acidisphaera rubrifaciens HS-AP3]